jgi:hypothetical protein
MSTKRWRLAILLLTVNALLPACTQAAVSRTGMSRRREDSRSAPSTIPHLLLLLPLPLVEPVLLLDNDVVRHQGFLPELTGLLLIPR